MPYEYGRNNYLSNKNVYSSVQYSNIYLKYGEYKLYFRSLRSLNNFEDETKYADSMYDILVHYHDLFAKDFRVEYKGVTFECLAEVITNLIKDN